jgi:hypothetical protein
VVLCLVRHDSRRLQVDIDPQGRGLSEDLSQLAFQGVEECSALIRDLRMLVGLIQAIFRILQ